MKLNKKNAVVLTGLLGAATIAGTVAYYSGFTQTEENQFTIVAGEKNQSGAGTIEEPSWDPDNATDLQPNATVPKDPSIKSNLEYDAWAFIKVEMPTVSAQVEGDSADKVYDAFDYIYNSNDWILISTENSGKSDTAGTDSVYIYAYKTPLAAGDQTSTLFDEMTVPDYTKLLNGLEGSVDITGYLIQTEGFASYTDAAKELGFEGSETDPGGEDETEQEDPEITKDTTQLRSGSTIRNFMAEVAGYLDFGHEATYPKIQYFEKSEVAPEPEFETKNIAQENQPEVLIWFDEGTGTIYYYTEAKKISFGESSSDTFNGFSGLISVDLSDFDVTNATSLEYFFNGCTKLREINVSNWNTGNVTSIRGMCYGCKALTDIIGIENWNTHSLTDTHEAFYECASLENIDLSKWDVSSLTDMSNMFRRACKLSNETTASMNNWKINTSADFSGMFKYCNDPNEGGRADFQFPTWDGQWDETEGTFTPNT